MITFEVQSNGEMKVAVFYSSETDKNCGFEIKEGMTAEDVIENIYPALMRIQIKNLKTIEELKND